MEIEYVYSLNNEDWNDLESIMNDVNDNNELGSVVEIYKGEKHDSVHAEFLYPGSIVEYMQERAYDEGGEHTEGYLDDLTEDQEQELRMLVLTWLNKNAKKPRFYSVKNTVKETVIAEEI